MSTTEISSQSYGLLNSLLQSAGQFEKDFAQLGSNLMKGDLAAAQQDWATISADALSSPLAKIAQAGSESAPAYTAPQSSTSAAQDALLEDFSALREELASGTLAGAKASYDAAEKDSAAAAKEVIAATPTFARDDSGAEAEMQTLLDSLTGSWGQSAVGKSQIAAAYGGYAGEAGAASLSVSA